MEVEKKSNIINTIKEIKVCLICINYKCLFLRLL